MEDVKRHSAPATIWAYGYEIAPPIAKERLRPIKTVLDEEHSDARLGARTWKARFVVEERVVHILVVSDSPDQDREVNRRLEAELKKLNASYSVTAPLAVVNQEESPPTTDPSSTPVTPD